MSELILLILLSIITARLLERHYKVASVAHAILFIVTMAMFLLTTDIKPIRQLMIDWIGASNYAFFLNAFITPRLFLNIGINGLVMLETVIFVFMPLLSIVALIKEFKVYVKRIVKSSQNRFRKVFQYISEAVDSDNTNYISSHQESYLILGKLLN